MYRGLFRNYHHIRLRNLLNKIPVLLSSLHSKVVSIVVNKNEYINKNAQFIKQKKEFVMLKNILA